MRSIPASSPQRSYLIHMQPRGVLTPRREGAKRDTSNYRIPISNLRALASLRETSTRPGAESVDVAEEKRRVIPVIEELAGEALLSIDTSKAEVAAAALDAGAKIVNDVTGGRGDDAMWPLLAKRGAAFIIMHMQGSPPTMQRAPSYHDVVAEVADFFRQQYAGATKFGLDPMTLAFDPGIGFGKTLEHNLSLLKNLPRLRVNDRPLVVGVSRKSFLGKISGHNGSIHNRLLPTVAFTSLLRMNGADVLRVHDVEENVEALRVADALRSAP